MRARWKNHEIADLLGVTEEAVSRYRGGTRIPRMETQMKIESVFGWTVSAQARARSKGEWATRFERTLCRISQLPVAA